MPGLRIFIVINIILVLDFELCSLDDGYFGIL